MYIFTGGLHHNDILTPEYIYKYLQYTHNTTTTTRIQARIIAIPSLYALYKLHDAFTFNVCTNIYIYVYICTYIKCKRIM